VSDHPNAERMRALFKAFGDQDIDAIRDAIAPDAVWRFPGKTGRLAGEHRGHEGIFNFLLRVMELTNGTFALDLEDVVANDNYAVALFRGHGSRPDGRELDNPTCLKIRLEGGKAVEIDEFVWNLYDVDGFWG
jgi:ketosteroid isomerase-like protein